MKKIFSLLIILLVCFSFSSCYWNAEKIKKLAPARFAEGGFSIVALEGTQMSITGGSVWYILEKNGGGPGLYQGYLSYMLSGDLGIYSLASIDALEARVAN